MEETPIPPKERIEMYYYILDGKAPVPVSAQVFVPWFETTDTTVKRTTISSDVLVSTLFLGVDQRFVGDGPPILFETRICGGTQDGDTWRYTTWDEAKVGHDHVVSMLQGTGKGGKQ